MLFERIISIDWSGAASETSAVDLRIALHEIRSGRSELVERRSGNRRFKSWTRQACRQWLRDRLAEEPTTLVAMDFGFGYPWGTDEAVFGVQGWHALVAKVRALYEAAGTARATAEAINAEARFGGHGPFRFNDSRADFRFYLEHQVCYYRLADAHAPQAISQWYLGSGGTVGFHSITGIAALGSLIEQRKRGELDFEVWPQEVWEPSGERHLLVESYPALCEREIGYGPCSDGHQKDAWRVLTFLRERIGAGSVRELFRVPALRSGRVEGVAFEEQVQFEGFILGLR